MGKPKSGPPAFLFAERPGQCGQRFPWPLVFLLAGYLLLCWWPEEAKCASVLRGFSGTQIFNLNSGESIPEPVCGVLAGPASWVSYQAPGGGYLLLDSIGSAVDTVMAIYGKSSGSPPFQFALLACDYHGAPGGGASFLRVPVQVGGSYFILLSGVNNAGGVVHFNYRLSTLTPLVTNQPSSQTVIEGTNLALTLGAVGNCNGIGGNCPVEYQWRLNGANIIGATNAVLTLTNAGPTKSGAYSVALDNHFAVTNSQVADVIIFPTNVPPLWDTSQWGVSYTADSLSNRSSLNHWSMLQSADGLSGALCDRNVDATLEPGEPLHAGRRGGASVWYGWSAPTNGIMTIRTTGSGFDTLLAVYTNLLTGAPVQVTNLYAIASDNDDGGFFSSAVTFTALSGVEYLIAVDGLDGAHGNIVLNWGFTATNQTALRIIVHPLSQLAQKGDAATMTVTANGSGALHYQWFFNGVPIIGATGSSLTRTNLNDSDVGIYIVQVSDVSGQSLQSRPAYLELGLQANGVSQDKFDDVLDSLGGNLRSRALAHSLIVVAAGTLGSQVLVNTLSTTEAQEPNLPSIGGASRWLSFQPQMVGEMTVDTQGSQIDTVIAAYTGSNVLTLKNIAANDNVDGDHAWSRIRFLVYPPTSYLLAVDGVRGAEGLIRVNWSLNRPADIPVLALPLGKSLSLAAGTNFLYLGTNLALQQAITAGVAAKQWLRNHETIPGANSEPYLLGSLQPTNAGLYSLMLSVPAATFEVQVANVQIQVPRLSVFLATGASGTQLHIITTNPPTDILPFVLETTTNWTDWSGILTNGAGAPLNFSDVSRSNQPLRFYRPRP